MQLVAYGAQDVYLTGNPQITFFKVVYRRHTNFSMECIEIPMQGTAGFGRRPNVTITRNGDLITKIYLMVTINRVTLSQGSKFGWVRRLGTSMINEIDVEIGGARIDRQFGVWLNIWWELSRHAGDGERGYLNMIGDVPALTDYNDQPKPEKTLYVPLKFWFNRHVGLALPLIALQYHEVRMNIQFTDAERLYVSNENFKANDYRGVSIKDAILLVDFIYLDSEERRRFAQVGHEYLIEQLQFTGEESVTSPTGRYPLKYNHPTKELVWAMRQGNYMSGQQFVYYTNSDDWASKVNDAALKILQESILLLNAAICEPDCYDNGHSTLVTPGEQPPSQGNWEDFNAGEAGTTANGNISVTNQSSDKALWVNTDSLVVASQQSYSLTGKIYAHITVSADNVVSITNVSTDLTVRDLSFPVSLLVDTRATRDDAIVWQHHNFGILIDGSENPVQEALIQLNGHDRFDKRRGEYFNYVQPDQHHTNTPADGINVYSFALNPEQHQPSGTANLSRIDSTQLNIWFADSTQTSGLPSLNFFNSDNKLYVFAYNYNVLRIMSGMGGVAYSN